MNRKLGKNLARHDTRTLRLARLLSADLPPAPAELDLTMAGGIPMAWPMLANDNVGDCTCAAAGHMIEVWADRGAAPYETIYQPREAGILAAYSAVSGYEPGDSYTDNGAVMIDVLNYWRKVGIDGHSIGGYAALEPRNIQMVKQAAYLFEGVYIGLQLPLTAQKQLDAGEVWDVEGDVGDAQAGSWGGHCVNVVGYDEAGLTVVTWAALQTMTWAFWQKYCDEAYAIFSEDMFARPPDGKDVEGFDRGSVASFLSKIGGVGADPAPVPPLPSPPPNPAGGGGKPVLAIVIFTGLGTDPAGPDCGMRAVAQKIADEHPEFETHILAFGWDDKPPSLYTNDPDGLCRYILTRILALSPAKIIGLRHSFGGALGIFFDQWLWTWYSGPEKIAPPLVFDLVVNFDPVTHGTHFGAGQEPGWFEPETTAPDVFVPYQRDGLLIGIKGEPVYQRAGVTNLDVSSYRDPQLGHIDMPVWIPPLLGIINDKRVQADVFDYADAALEGKGAR